MLKVYLVLVIYWIIYFFLHSYLASEAVKNWFKKALNEGFKYYRLGYNLISTVGLMTVLLMNASIVPIYLIEGNGWTKFGGLVLASWGVIIIRLAFKHYDANEFLGLRQLKMTNNVSKLNIKGPSKYVRHPLYSATILIIIGFWLFAPTVANFVTAGCIVVYLGVGIWLEEKKLVKEYGQDYLEYRKKVPMLFPKFG